MAKKQKCPECVEGAPDWLVGYGDMVTLLLCFFVFLLVTAKVDVAKLDAASGYMAQKMGLLPNNTSVKKKKDKQDAQVGEKGEEEKVTMIEEGKKLSLGGKEMFEKGKAVPDLTENFQKDLLGFARQIRGLRNIIEIRGHAGKNEVDSKSIFRDEQDLSIERARSIYEYMVNTGKIRPERIRIVGCGSNERLESNLWLTTEEKNRRVEIRVLAKYQDFNPNTIIK